MQCPGFVGFAIRQLQTGAPLEQGISNDGNREFLHVFGADQGTNRRRRRGGETRCAQVASAPISRPSLARRLSRRARCERLDRLRRDGRGDARRPRRPRRGASRLRRAHRGGAIARSTAVARVKARDRNPTRRRPESTLSGHRGSRPSTSPSRGFLPSIATPAGPESANPATGSRRAPAAAGIPSRSRRGLCGGASPQRQAPPVTSCHGAMARSTAYSVDAFEAPHHRAARLRPK